MKPNGQKRHPLSFSPFLGGKRICIGKTFAEIVVKLVVIGLVGKFNFEFADPAMKIKEKPILNVDMEVQP